MLFDAPIKPLEADVRQTGSRTLLLSLDGPLRCVPMAALRDGERWLAEMYPSAVVTMSAMKLLGKEGAAAKPAAAALGVTASWPGFPAFPGVAAEIEAVVGGAGCPGAMEGKSFPDAAFDRATFASSLSSGAQVVRVASHFTLDPTCLARTSLLLGDGARLSLDGMRTSADFDFTGLDLLTLSACDTVSGARRMENGFEAESMGEAFQRVGASSVLAALLPVDDMSGPEPTREFYRLRYAEG
ncbi:MAG: CHAT domain-containing protein [Deltaproteobacteria bacterium]|jgi:CHAT domain-containing protein|nr:CHAT domain-containing protein [Deltaproteobacteria bacterium]